MPFNAKATGWTTIFLQSGGMIVIPEELTRKWWDKKKQVLAKTKATGVGDKLDELASIFDRINWPSLGGNPVAIQGDIDNCKKLITGSTLNAFRDKLKDIRDTASKEAKEYAKSPLTKKTAAVLEDMRVTADHLFVASNGASLSTLLTNALDAWQKDQKAKAMRSLGPTLAAIKTVIAKTPAKLKDIKTLLATFQSNEQAPNAREDLGNAIRNLCRDTTQPLGNLMKSAKAGAALTGYDEGAAEKLYNAMVKISNTKGTEFMDKLGGSQAGALVKLVESWAKEFDKQCGDVAAGADVTI